MLRLLVVLFLLPLWLAADRIDDLVRAEMEKNHVPGIALAVIRSGEPARLQGYGLANLEHGVPVTPKTAFKLASVSKHFFAAAVLLLTEEGKIALSDSVRKHIPEAPLEWEGITIRHLLSHTGGLLRECPAFDAFKPQPDFDLIRSAFPRPLEFQPGEKYQYSNTGYFTIAEIIRRLSGQSWEEFIEKRLFQPAGMHATRTTTTRQLIANRSGGYDWSASGWTNAADYFAVRPSGAFVSTLEDMVRWDAALSTGVPLKKALREQMWQPVPLNDGTSSGYALGWSVARRKGRQVVHHGGSLPGFRTHYARFPEDNLSILVLANASTAQAGELVWRIAAEYLPGFE